MIGQHGSDFYAVREYRMGDDLRRVHWPSTARLDDLMIRQEETPSQGRLTVAVDLRPSAWAEGGLETALSAAASVAEVALAEGLLVRLLTSTGGDTLFGAWGAQRAVILDALAAVGVRASTPDAALGRTVDAAPGEAVVVITSSGQAGRGMVAGFVATQPSLLTAVMIAPDRGLGTNPEPFAVRSIRIVGLTGGIDGLPEAWGRSQASAPTTLNR